MHRGMSELEFQLELENEGTDDDGGSELADEELADEELHGLAADELADNEDSSFAEFEADDELDDSEAEDDIESDLQSELLEPDVRGFGERLHELSLREFESPQELEREIGQVLDEMEQDYFFGSLGKLVKGAGKALIKQGVAYAKKRIPIASVIEGVTALSRGNLKGALGSFAKSAVGALSNYPAFAAVMPALDALGFKPGSSPNGRRRNRAAWRKFAKLGKHAFQNLASGLTQTADQPAEAARVAGRAYEMALQQVKTGTPALTAGRSRVRVIRLRPGERILIKA